MKTMVGQAISYFRLLNSFTQNDLVNHTGLSYSYISKIEAGILDNPSLKAVSAIARALNVAIDELLSKDQVLSSVQPKPFIKWAGGKRQMLDSLSLYFPKKIGTYFEPFLGGGAVYFNTNYKRCYISDTNAELINTYRVVKSRLAELIQMLDSMKNTESDYYLIRAQNVDQLTELQRAARFIYLNRTCYNGLYRVNKEGRFNVPYGKNSNKALFDYETLYLSSRRLQKTKLECLSYLEAIKNAKKGDFVFFDPPYYPVGQYADFTRYTKDFFYKQDHEILAEVFEQLDKKGIFVLMTNSNTAYTQQLYKAYPTKVIKTKRLISSRSSTREGEDMIIVGKKLHDHLS